MSGPLLAALDGRRVAACVGPGGVGKTTVAAALGLAQALQGRRVLVCTIDPARRLANALGLSGLGNAEARVPPARLREAGLELRGELWAMMLDVKRTWDDLVARYAPDRGRRERIYRNRIYQQLSSALAGSQEYMAMEKLYELAGERDYDLVVLDTPPTAHALDFLDAPERMLDFLGNDGARTLLAPAVSAGRVGLRLFQAGSSLVAKGLARFTGAQVLEELGELIASFGGMYEGFKARAAAVRTLLGSPSAGFVVVSSAGPRAVDEARAFRLRLEAERMPVAALVANRVSGPLWPVAAGPRPSAAVLAGPLAEAGAPGASLAARLALTLDEHERTARADAAEVERLFEGTTAARLVLPRLPRDVHSLGSLAEIAARL